MRWEESFPFEGRIVWLTAEQGGRMSGPPATPAEHDYAATAHVPPWTEENGSASFVLRVADRHGWTSRAEGTWLVQQDDERFLVHPGTVIVVTEGYKVVAYFHVDTVSSDR
ncbi:hypothetical protein CLV92_1306 [Kineococcus xinjiangensis]|uniref:Uncharacterized protein n=1 Tax=Kineococcus xinjiangensis TaxID=512762 RepID=A0A2S6IBT5_9ACTN|nr:hypothetical protein [Kineococcus xinjiangensis]PPK89817.1 hypothetical protein CLV92_1306 [Kineococcus xinjiangensis]